jgi:hypothetical protein
VLGDQGEAGDDGGGDRGGAADRDGFRILQEGFRQAGDFGRHGGGEKQRLPVLRQEADNFLDVRDEAHVQHAVRFVDDQHAAIGEQQAAALEQVEQAAGGGDQHVHTLHERVLLIVQAFAADQQRVVQLQVFAVKDEILRNLKCQLAGRLQDEAARHAGAGAAAVQDVQHGEREAGGLAGASLRHTHDVTSGQDDRNGLRLDGGGMQVSLFDNGTQNRFGKAGFGEQRQRLVGRGQFVSDFQRRCLWRTGCHLGCLHRDGVGVGLRGDFRLAGVWFGQQSSQSKTGWRPNMAPEGH